MRVFKINKHKSTWEWITDAFIFLYLSIALIWFVFKLFDYSFFTSDVDVMQILSTAIVVVVTYLIYRLNSEAKKADNYFEKISYQYFNIIELHYALEFLNANENNTINRIRFEYQMKASCNIMIYYLEHYPNNSFDCDKMIVTLLSISRNPYYTIDFETLSNEFNELCKSINQKHQKYVSFMLPKMYNN